MIFDRSIVAILVALLLLRLPLLVLGQTFDDGHHLERSPFLCNAAYSTPCSRMESEWLATWVARDLQEAGLQDGCAANSSTNAILEAMTTQHTYSFDLGFYPFVLDRETGLMRGHGANPNLIGLHLDGVFQSTGNNFSDTDALLGHFQHAYDTEEGEWVPYFWSSRGSTNSTVNQVVINSKLAYIVGVPICNLMVGVGYEEEQMPPSLPCRADMDSWCSITNVRSLLGAAQFRMEHVESIHAFERALHDFSFDSDSFQIPEGFYVFMYNYDGSMRAHGKLHTYFRASLWDMMVAQNLAVDERAGRELHESFVRAAEGEGNGWVRYDWRNDINEDPYPKISYIMKYEFGGQSYYLGVGFQFRMEPLHYDGGDVSRCDSESNRLCAFNASRHLSSHASVQALTTPPDETELLFEQISTDPSLRRDDFYVFAFDYNSTCVAHGRGDKEYVGLPLQQILELKNLTLDAEQLNNDFITASQRGGGNVVFYSWQDSTGSYQKISHMFRMVRNGRQYYAGVGFRHTRADVSELADGGGKCKNGDPILCSTNFGTPCSLQNVRAITGKALADLVLASSEAFLTSADKTAETTVPTVLSRITAGDPAYQVNDFFVAVFSVDGDECENADGSGCCIASGEDSSQLYLTWNEILRKQQVEVELSGSTIHQDLTVMSAAGGGLVKQNLVFTDKAQAATTKHYWAGGFTHNDRKYYVVSSYMAEQPGFSCDACPKGWKCSRKDQEFCEETNQAKRNALIIVASAVAPLLALIVLLLIQYRKLTVDRMKGILEVTRNLPIHSIYQYPKVHGQESAPSNAIVTWYWRVEARQRSNHVAVFQYNHGYYVKYSSTTSDSIEAAYTLYQYEDGPSHVDIDLSHELPDGPQSAGVTYTVTFEGEHWYQRNNSTGTEKGVIRRSHPIPHDFLSSLPELPTDILDTEEDLLPLFRGQLIQIVKVHPMNKKWAFGSLLYDEAKFKGECADPELLAIRKGFHDSRTSGWFPLCITKPGRHDVVQKLLKSVGEGGMNVLRPPSTWTNPGDNEKRRVNVSTWTKEYKDVARYFTDNLRDQRDVFEVVKVERIQNLSLWKLYAVKRQTMSNRDTQRDDIEWKWLFHGTSEEVANSIIRAGFKCTFAGLNSGHHSFGIGVYFSLTSDVSSRDKYSAASNGIKHMFLSRVAVGEYATGKPSYRVPPPKDDSGERYDSTVNDTSSPTTFVVYHDSQAYPEYLVTFRRRPIDP